MDFKVCIDCEKGKPLSDFYINGVYNGKQYFRGECKKCHSIRKMKNYIRKPPIEKKCIYCGEIIRLVYQKKRGKICSKKECKNRYDKDYRNLIKNEIFNLLGGQCVRCGFSDRRILQIDHVHGGGVKEWKSFGGGHSYLKRVLEKIQSGSKDYQLLCPNHNWLKRIENNEQ